MWVDLKTQEDNSVRHWTRAERPSPTFNSDLGKDVQPSLYECAFLLCEQALELLL